MRCVNILKQIQSNQMRDLPRYSFLYQIKRNSQPAKHK